MNIPSNPYVLLSFINTKLRDSNMSFEHLVLDLELDENLIKEKLKNIGYFYDQSTNQFK